MNKQEQGMFIRKKRIEKGLTAKELAEKIGLESSTLTHIEHGDHWGSVKTLKAIEQELGLDRGTLSKSRPTSRNTNNDPTGLKALRKKCGLTQVQTAQAIGISRDTLNNLEQGASLCRSHLIPEIKEFLSKKLHDVHMQSIFKHRSYSTIKAALCIIKIIEAKPYFQEV